MKIFAQPSFIAAPGFPSECGRGGLRREGAWQTQGFNEPKGNGRLEEQGCGGIPRRKSRVMHGEIAAFVHLGPVRGAYESTLSAYDFFLSDRAISIVEPLFRCGDTLFQLRDRLAGAVRAGCFFFFCKIYGVDDDFCYFWWYFFEA